MVAGVSDVQSFSTIIETHLPRIAKTRTSTAGILPTEVKGDRSIAQLTFVLVVLHSYIHDYLKLHPMPLPYDVIEQLALWTDDDKSGPTGHSETLPQLNVDVVDHRVSDPVPADMTS